ncbi:MAG: hypothetical protein R3F59_11865 [Myxococcota bacterium]
MERLELTGQGMLGQAQLGAAAITWRGLPPELSLWAEGSRAATGLGAGALGADATFRLRRWAALALGPQAVATRDAAGPRVRSLRAVGALALRRPPDRGETGGGSASTATAARSERLRTGTSGEWGRVALSGDAVLGTGVRVGPLREHRTRIALSGTLAATGGATALDERVFVGGDLPGALRFGAPSGSVPLAGFAPTPCPATTWRRARRALARPGGAAAADPRGAAVPAQGFALGLGAAPLWVGPQDVAAVGSLSAELRWSALLLDAPWDGGLRLSWGLGDPPGSVWTPPRVALGGPRAVLSLGVALSAAPDQISTSTCP